MAQVTWKKATSGSWQTGSNWNTGSVPGTGDDALLTPTGSFDVVSTSFVEVHSVQLSAGATLDITSGGFQLDDGTGSGANAGTIIVENNNNLTLGGGVDNSGTISVASAGNATEIRLNAASVQFSGAGQVVLSDNSNNYILSDSGASDTLVNVNDVFSGAGQFGNGGMGLDNEAKGTIDATGTVNALVLDLGSGVVGINAGKIESTTAGGLVIDGGTTIDSTSGGTIAAAGPHANVQLSNATLRGGTLLTTGTGVIETSNGSGTLDGTAGAINNTGAFVVSNNTNLVLYGTINNTGTISENSTGNTTQIIVAGPTVTLTGGGALVMAASTANYVDGNNPGYELVNVNNTISGGGNLGNNEITIVNDAAGIIDGNTTTALTLQTQNLVTNLGLMEGTAGGTLQIYDTTVNNSGGTLLASGGTVDLNGAGILGGLLRSTAGGTLQTVGNNSSLDGLTLGAVKLSGTLTVTNNTLLYLDGMISDASSTIDLSSTGNTTQIQITGVYNYLQGGGSLVLSNSDSNYVQSNGGNFQNQLINVDNTISGTGHLGNGNMTLVNQAAGVIDANNAEITNAGGTVISSGVLALDADGGVTNAGLIEDTGTAGLAINSTNVVQSAAGVIAAKGKGAHVDLNSSAIVGGILQGTGGGVIQTTSGTSVLDGLTSGAIKLTGAFVINNNTDLDVNGVFNNTGTVSETSSGNTTEFRVNSWTVTLEGGGVVKLSDFAQNYILASFSQWQTLDNLNDTISGSGQIGNGAMQLDNSGTIDATGTSNQLVISLGNGSSGINNAGGLWEGTGTAGLVISDGFFTNNGTVAAFNGSSVSYQSSATNFNMSNGVLTGGTWEAISTGGAATVSISGGSVTTDAASIVLSGTGSVFQAGNGSSFTAIESTLATIAAGGSLTIEGGRVYTTTLALADNGTLALAGSGTTLTAASLAVGSGGTLTGNGTVKTNVTNAGTVTAAGGVLDLTGNLSGSGGAVIASGGTLEVDKKLSGNTVTYAAGGSNQVLALKMPSTTTSSIVGFGKNATIDLLNIGVTKLSYAGTTSSGVLTVSSGTSTVAKLDFTGDYTTASFSFKSDGNNGTDIFGTGSLAKADLTAAGGFDAASWQAAAAGTTPTVLAAGGSLYDFTPAVADAGYAPVHHA